MFERRSRRREGPLLFDRVLASRCRRVAILGLHPGAGARTVLRSLVLSLRGRLSCLGLTSAPRVPLEPDESDRKDLTRVTAPAGTLVATAASASDGHDRALELVERTGCSTQMGEVSIYRAVQEVEVGLYGPPDPPAMRAVLERLAELGAELVLVEGGFERRAFAAPGAADGVVLVVGSGYSASPARSAAAARYVVETFRVPPCAEEARAAWQETASKGAVALLDRHGEPAGVLPPGLDNPVPALRDAGGEPVGTIVLPHGLDDEFLIPLVRSSLRCALVVRDATRIHVSPVYFKAWLKSRGTIQVVRPLRLIAVATNPTNAAGPDADPEGFRAAVARALPDLPVHDVVLEAAQTHMRRPWRLWE